MTLSMSAPKQRSNQKTPEAGQALQAFDYSSKLACTVRNDRDFNG